jgi:hypothetical protein
MNRSICCHGNVINMPNGLPIISALTAAFVPQEVFKKKVLYTGLNFRVKASRLPPILYVVVNSHALGGKFPHLAVHFQILNLIQFFHEVYMQGGGYILCPDNQQYIHDVALKCLEIS